MKIGVVCTNNSAATANIRVNSIDNQDKKSTQKIVLEPGRSQTVEVTISPDTPGYHWVKTWIEGDGFAADNQASTGIICGQTATVLFNGSPGEFGVLPTAFSPDNYGQLTGMISKFTRSGQIPQAQGEKPILIVTTWEEISRNNQASSGLRQYVEAGGNLLIVPSARRAGTNWLCFFKFLLTAEFAENAEETKSPSQLHQREFLHIKNLCALSVLGGKI